MIERNCILTSNRIKISTTHKTLRCIYMSRISAALENVDNVAEEPSTPDHKRLFNLMNRSIIYEWI